MLNKNLRISKFTKKLTFIFLGLILYETCLVFPYLLRAKPIEEKKLLSKNYISKGKGFANDFKLIVNKDLIKNSILANLIPDDQKSNKGNYSIDIESDIQYQKDDIFFAEGNVIVFLDNAQLKADYLSYDRSKKFLVLKGNIQFKKGLQFLEASEINYDISSQNGFIKDVYGVISINEFPNDLNIKNFSKNNINKEKKNFYELPTDLKLLSTNSIEFSKRTFDFELPQIQKWRFKSDYVNINPEDFTSELIYFTNDPYNKPQFVLESKNFIGEFNENENLKLSSKSTFIILEDFFRLPIGKRTIQDSESSLRWGFGYDEGNKDGFYAFRNSDPIKFGNYKLNLRTYYFLQRYISGETEVFREKESSLNSAKVKQNSNLIDSLGIESELLGGFLDYDLELNTSIDSLNFDRINESFSADILLQKSFYEKESDEQDSENLDYLKISSGLAIYGIYNKDEIHNGFGSRIVNQYINNKKDYGKNYNLVLDIGNYFAESNDGNEYLSLNRYGILGSLSHSYNIINFNNKDITYSSNYKYSPNIIDQGISFNTSISGGAYQYSNDVSQNTVAFSYGPTLIKGKMLDNFFDYTSISLRHEIITKKGRSPFSFDAFDDASRLRLSLEQQIFGPITFAFNTKYNLEDDEFYDNKYDLNIKRRAYSIGAFYDQDEKIYGFKFAVFNFGYKGNSSKF